MYGSIDINDREWQTCLQRQPLRPRSPLELRGWPLWRHTPDISPSLGQAQEPPEAGSLLGLCGVGVCACVCVCVEQGRGRGTKGGDAATHLSLQFEEHQAVWTDKSPVPRKIPQEGPLFIPVNEPYWPADAKFPKRKSSH